MTTMIIMTRKELYKLKKIKSGILSKPSPPKFPTFWTIKISKKYGIFSKSYLKKSKSHPRSSRSKASTLPFSSKLWKKLTKISQLMPLQIKRKNLTKIPLQLLTQWDKNSKTRFYLNLILTSRNSLKIKMPTLQVMNKKLLNLPLNLNQTLMKKMRLEAIGDLRISWSEENISWKRKKKPIAMTIKNMMKNKNKKLSKNMPLKKERKRNKNSTWQKIIKRKKFKSSPSKKLKPRSRILSTLSTNSPQRTNVRSILTIWMKSSNNPKIIKISRSFHSYL